MRDEYLYKGCLIGEDTTKHLLVQDVPLRYPFVKRLNVICVK